MRINKNKNNKNNAKKKIETPMVFLTDFEKHRALEMAKYIVQQDPTTSLVEAKRLATGELLKRKRATISSQLKNKKEISAMKALKSAIRANIIRTEKAEQYRSLRGYKLPEKRVTILQGGAVNKR